MGESPVLMSGNEAAGEGAIRAGCRFYAGYPITPQNELTAYMADQMPLHDHTFIQAESELAAINMVFGAATGGARAMTSTSSPGFSLKQEGLSYMAGCELPGVIVNVQRAGPGLGGIGPGQADYFQATRGAHGDYRCIVLAPTNAQEMADLTYQAFDLADRYRNPVIVLSDGLIGQLMESVRFDHLAAPDVPQKPWALTGEPGRPRRRIYSLRMSVDANVALNDRLQAKYAAIESAEQRYKLFGPADADICLVAFGTCARICRQVVQDAADTLPVKVALLQPVTLWPFPTDGINAVVENARRFLSVEMNAGQMVEDVRLTVAGRRPVDFLGRMGGAVPTAEEIRERIRQIAD